MVLEWQQIYIIVFFNVFSKLIWYEFFDKDNVTQMPDARSNMVV